jgi:hypothetical protein
MAGSCSDCPILAWHINRTLLCERINTTHGKEHKEQWRSINRLTVHMTLHIQHQYCIKTVKFGVHMQIKNYDRHVTPNNLLDYVAHTKMLILIPVFIYSATCFGLYTTIMRHTSKILRRTLRNLVILHYMTCLR